MYGIYRLLGLTGILVFRLVMTLAIVFSFQCLASRRATHPLIAVILSLAATGLGQIYCGRIVRGLVLFLGSLLFAPAIVVAALLPPATIVLVGLILALLTVLGVYVFAVVDAFRLARRGRDLFQSMDYDHPLSRSARVF